MRLLAHWHARRREVDELLEPLLAHGPAAVERVSARLDELTQALAAERTAFEAFAAAAALAATGRAVPGCGPWPVDEVAVARRRAERTRAAMSAAVHPSVLDVLHHLDPAPEELRLLDAPAPREHQDEGEPADS